MMQNVSNLKKKTIRVAYLDNASKRAGSNIEREQFEESLFGIILTKHYHTIYDPKNPDFIIVDYHFAPYVPNNVSSIVYMHEAFLPNFNMHDYGIGFDYLDFNNRYVRFPYWLTTYSNKNIAQSTVNDFPSITTDEAHEKLKEKTQFCNYVVSNSAYADPTREEFFHTLSKYKQVSSGGRHLNNVGGPVHDLNAFISKGKFTIAFENNSKTGYTTEKILHGFYNHSIPIYWGNPDVGKEFNTETFINAHDYNSFDEVIKRVKEIDNDDALWSSIISKSPKIHTAAASQCLKNLEDFLCMICEAKQSNRVFAKPSLPAREAMSLWLLLSKNKIATPMLQKTLKFLHPKKLRESSSTVKYDTTTDNQLSTLQGFTMHTRCGESELLQSPVYQYLSQQEFFNPEKYIPVHFYFDYDLHEALHLEYRSHINIHVTSKKQAQLPTCYIPDLSVFDFAIGYENINYPKKYFNLTNAEDALPSFLEHIFQSVDSYKKQKGISILYCNILEKIWENHRILHTYRYKTTSFGLYFSLFLTKIISKLYKKMHRFLHRTKK